MAKKKRGPAYIREARAHWGRERGQATRKRRAERAAAVLEKGRFGSFSDVFDLFMGLSSKAQKLAALAHLWDLAARGYRPTDVVKRLEESWKSEEAGKPGLPEGQGGSDGA